MSLTGLLRPVAERIFPRVYTPERYGAASAFSSGVDDTTFVQAAITAAQSAGGGRVYLRRVYNIPTGGLTITAPVTMEGGGGSAKGGSSILTGFDTASGTAVLLTISASNFVLKNFACRNSNSLPTAGAAIQVTSSSSATYGDIAKISHVDTINFYDNVIVSAGSYWRYENCYNYNAWRHGLTISNADNPDGGDQFITNNAFVTVKNSPGAAIYWTSGGGTKIIGNKINGNGTPAGFRYGIHFKPTAHTGVWVVSGNSIENTNYAAIKYEDTGASVTTHSLVIVGNQVGIYSANAAAVAAIEIRGGTSANLGNLLIADNLLLVDGTTLPWGILVDGVEIGTIGKNQIVPADTSVPPKGGIYLGVNNVAVEVATQAITGTTAIIKDASSVQSASHKGRALVEHRYQRQIPTVGKGAVVPIYSIALDQYANCVATLTLTGRVTNSAGDFTIRATRSMRRYTTGACAVATVGTDFTDGSVPAEVLLTFDTSTTTGQVIIGLQLGSGSAGADILGFVNLNIEGAPTAVIRGTATIPTAT